MLYYFGPILPYFAASQKAQRGVHLVDLAAYIDKRRAAAVKECCQPTGRQEYEFGTTNLAENSGKV